jgi:hypothetical protein
MIDINVIILIVVIIILICVCILIWRREESYGIPENYTSTFGSLARAAATSSNSSSLGTVLSTM